MEPHPAQQDLPTSERFTMENLGVACPKAATFPSPVPVLIMALLLFRKRPLENEKLQPNL